jgi:NAD(P)-dependent dehydrogenase (short-subunit alcohol dehydrogenase family)
MSTPIYTPIPGLQGKFAVVTGSSAGIGLAIAATFAKSGAHVVVNGRSDASCDKAVKKIALETGCDPSALIPVAADISTAAGCKDFVEKTNAALKRVLPNATAIDILVNNAGIFKVKDFFEITDEEWEEYHNVNIMSGVRLSRAFLKPMLERGKETPGRVIFISSECGVRSLPHMIPYSASKASQINIARGLAELCKGTRVTVNSVLPGPTMTEGVQDYLKGFAEEKKIPNEKAEEQYFSEHERTSLLQRFLTPQEVANTVAFLCSDLGSGINGNSQRVEGGIIYHI